MVSGRLRLDQFLVTRGFFASRSRAQDAIARGAVEVDGASALKPSQTVHTEAKIAVHDEAAGYASRSALKLKHALDHFQLDANVALALDIGASAGGFTQVLLERGARQVVAIDVGHGQLAPELRADPRVRLLEGLNIRELRASHLQAEVDFIACDVSFISLKLALPPALALAAPSATLVALIKPQYEAGPKAVAGSGVVRDPVIHRLICDHIESWLSAQPSWRVIGLTPSPILGGDGNREFLIAAQKSR
ncbi:MAG TPA: TlyA family RNA methyltransferase [Aestuariivirgaceae bacterium]|jgi:23S rRNA (cytidine1920-2'-O)/16S rRNA (cytidine1409-2'-O)-methyltransferase